MKKIYFAPKTDIMTVKFHPLMEASLNGSGEVESISESGDYGGGTVLSRRGRNIWDDEEY